MCTFLQQNITSSLKKYLLGDRKSFPNVISQKALSFLSKYQYVNTKGFTSGSFPRIIPLILT